MPGPLNTAGGGLGQAVPDMINTPTPAGPVPMPCVNMAPGTNNNPGTTVLKVLIDGAPATNMMSERMCSVTTGMGVGVASGMINGPCRNIMGSTSVMMGNGPATGLCDPTAQNGMSPNAAGSDLVPAQIKVFKAK
ncbi:DUF4150 domain-containing protein [Vibrio sp. S4M6]|uniref:PAAR-like domain-containing protein n=1 Tax=Vibrio sinus TaxID=2946865 RepID=UPI00202A42FA|nr:PAAR-like domain-containing protein [Vibrio sinus]MCL9782509.1 DUF4150 domain-containing protein [Vibrio sinus]